MAATSYDAMKKKNSDLVRKALDGSIFIAPLTAADPTSLTILDTTTTPSQISLQSLPAGWVDIGYCDQSDAVSWDHKTSTDDTDAWGAVEPIRSDINKVDSTLNFTMLETKRKSLELYYGLDLSAIKANATTGEFVFDQPSRPATLYFKLFGLFVDGAGTDSVYFGRLFRKASVTDMTSQKWSNKGTTVSYGVGVQAKTPAVGAAVTHYFGGPGWKNSLTAMDISV